MITVAREREAGARTPSTAAGIPPRNGAKVSRRQVALVRLVAAALAGATIAGAIALENGSGEAGRPAGRFAVPPVADVQSDAGGASFDDPSVVKGARGGSFDDPVVRKGAGGAPVR